uniref:Uncharacterized protein n=1 Tax=Anguilla anguilla TaxID=7936 RepID=A0A0E9XDY0_ANGAN
MREFCSVLIIYLLQYVSGYSVSARVKNRMLNFVLWRLVFRRCVILKPVFILGNILNENKKYVILTVTVI